MTAPAQPARRGNAFGDMWVIAQRGFLHMRRQPEALADATLQPIMFTLLFAYVFGGAIQVAGGNYREFLMGGIFAQTIVFGCFGVAMSLASDRKNGAIDRFRSMPMARSAVLSGHALSHLARGFIPIILMSVCGLIVGWRIHTSFADAVAGYALMLAFLFAVIWVGILLGSVLPSPEAVQGVGFAALFPVGALADISNSGTLFAFAMVAVAVLILRKRDPGRARPFRTPAVWLVSPLAAVGCVYLFWSLSGYTKLLFVGWAAIGLVVYYTYSRSRSHVGRGIVDVHEDDADIPPQPVPPLPGGIDIND